MQVSPLKPYAVLTGDVVGSSKLSPAERRDLPDLLRQASRGARKVFPKAIPFEIDIFRGDGWQLLVSEPALSLRIGFFFRASVLASAEAGLRVDTRLAVAVGGIDFIPAKRVSEGDGEAYRLSGQALDALREPQRMSFAKAGGDPAHAVIVQLLDALVQGWTPAQARAVLGRLQGRTQAEIARLWPRPIAQQAVGRHLEKARWVAIERGIRCIEDSLQRL